MPSRLCIAALLLTCVWAPAVQAKVFYSRQEALQLAFPDAEVQSETYVLRDDQISRIQELARSPIDSKLVKIYTGVRNGQVIGYALIDVHNVRTLPEAFMIVLTPEGQVSALRLLAFHEPLDYMPAGGFYDQFQAKTLEQPIRLGRDVHGIVGATLSARATTRGVRRALAFYQVLVRDEP